MFIIFMFMFMCLLSVVLAFILEVKSKEIKRLHRENLLLSKKVKDLMHKIESLHQPVEEEGEQSSKPIYLESSPALETGSKDFQAESPLINTFSYTPQNSGQNTLNVKNKGSLVLWQSRSSLVLGVLFVFFAGLIFATTTWSVLPSIIKISMLIASSAIFFFSSSFAEKKLHIHGTGRAFYVLGSIFLFVSVICIGFFKLLGPELTPDGSDKFFLFFAGAFLTEISLLCGLRKIKGIFFASIVLYGIDLCTVLFLLALKVDKDIFFICTTAYALVILLIERLIGETMKHGILHKNENAADDISIKDLNKQHNRKGIFSGLHIFMCGDSVIPAFYNFALNTLILASIFPMFLLGTGFISGIVTTTLACAHLIYGNKNDRSELNISAFILLLFLSIYRFMVPESIQELLFMLMSALAIFFMLDFTQSLTSKSRKYISNAAIITAAIAFIFCFSFINSEISIHHVLSMGLLFIYTSVQSLRDKRFYIGNAFTSIAFYILLVIYFNIPDDIIPFTTITAFLAVLILREKKLIPFRDTYSEIVYTICGLLYSLFYAVIYHLFKDYFSLRLIDMFTELYSLIFIIYLILRYGKKILLIKALFPIFGLLCVYNLVDISCQILNIDSYMINYDIFVLIYLTVLIVLDAIKPDQYIYAAFMLASIYGFKLLFIYNSDSANILICSAFFMVQAAYLYYSRYILKGYKDFAGKCSCIYFLLCSVSFLRIFDRLSIVDYMILITAIAWCMYIVSLITDKTLTVFIMLMISLFHLILIWELIIFYESAFNDILIFVSFAVLYMISYRKNIKLVSVLNALLFIPFFPSLFYNYTNPYNAYYGCSTDLVMTGISVLLVITVLFLRTKFNIIEFPNITAKADTDKNNTSDMPNYNSPDIRYDFYSMFSCIIIFILILMGNVTWNFIHMLLTSLYFIQYINIKGLKQTAIALSEACIVAACWIQPWFIPPALFKLELFLLPAALWTYSLGFISRHNKNTGTVQLLLYTLFMFALMLDVFINANVADALIFESLCISAYVYNSTMKKRIHSALSAAGALIVVLYMTRGFWSRIAWWLYLLIAGIGLIIYAALNEMKKK